MLVPYVQSNAQRSINGICGKVSTYVLTITAILFSIYTLLAIKKYFLALVTCSITKQQTSKTIYTRI